ncbi:hypothetical protein [Serratia microhaemolytica]|uniref:hypothetical protein n=1 Tax=Serratia microhaemolytica TaxID=2675110 RepID=UPI000FDCF85C|nr:hypothetical protein [Serratia microhaemolytica]
MRFYVNNLGFAVLEVGRSKQVIADFLGSDIQAHSDNYNMRLFLSVCHSIRNHEMSEWEGTGNAHTVIIKLNDVEIYNEFTEDNIHITLNEFEWYLKQWERFITTGEEFTIESPFD